MDTKLKSKWIKALRSGRYRQARGVLLRERTGGMCCLGVLAHIQGCPRNKILEQSMVLPPRGFTGGLTENKGAQLAALNDGAYCRVDDETYKRHNFKKIADFIEKNI